VQEGAGYAQEGLDAALSRVSRRLAARAASRESIRTEDGDARPGLALQGNVGSNSPWFALLRHTLPRGSTVSAFVRSAIRLGRIDTFRHHLFVNPGR